MGKAVLAEKYDALTPLERWSLLVQAGLRGDARERQRLLQSTDRLAFTVADFHGYGDAFGKIWNWWREEQLALAARFWRDLWLLSGTKDPEQHERHMDFLGLTAYQFIIQADGWRKFCAGFGIDADALERRFPWADDLEAAEELARKLVPLPEGVVRILGRLRGDGDTGDPLEEIPHEEIARVLTADDLAAGFREIMETLAKEWA